MRVAFLVRDLCHMGGVVSATQNLAGALADKHDVEIVALRKVRDKSHFALDSRVNVRALTDLRAHSPAYDGDDPLAHEFPVRYPYPESEKNPVVSRLAEKRLFSFLADTDADVVVSSNPRITALLAAAPGGYLKVAQEHSMPGIYTASIRRLLFKEAYRRLDAITVLSPEEQERLGDLVPDVRDRIHVMPNCIPDPGGRQSDGRNKVVVTAGVFKPHKNFLGLIDAFATVAALHSDWQLRIYGSGPEEAAMRRRIQEQGLYNHVHLMGPAFPVTAEFAKGSIFVLPSLREPFGNVTVEAMTRGLPVVSMDCDHGPRNILTHGTDGLLVPLGDTDAMTAAIVDLIEDDGQRLRMGRQARLTSERFGPGPSAERFEGILTEAAAVRKLPGTVDCAVLADGRVQLDLRPQEGEEGVPDGLTLLCRDVRGKEKPVALPFTGDRAVVPRLGMLAEGLWEFVVVSVEGREKPLHAEHCDSGSLVAPDWEAGTSGLEVLLPYTEEDDRLRVRSRVRVEHAEVHRIETGEHQIFVEGEFWGGEAVSTRDAVTAVHRIDKHRVLSFPVVWTDGVRFRCEIALEALVAEHGEEEVWDIWIQPTGAGPAQVGKLVTDVLEPHKVFRYPRPVRERVQPAVSTPRTGRRFLLGDRRARTLAAPTRVEIRPYYTTAAQLAFKTVTL
ncbi:glycosyltransferase [Streptomyces sp. SAI-129]|uniref:glycosyltransferase n=1 Tax=Streptomyces sp. SAI-129 TaxID=3377727 RepID=UPI003C7D86CB